MNKHKSQSGSSHLIIIIILVVALLGTLGFVFWQNYYQTKTTTQTKISNAKVVETNNSSSSSLPIDDGAAATFVKDFYISYIAVRQNGGDYDSLAKNSTTNAFYETYHNDLNQPGPFDVILWTNGGFPTSVGLISHEKLNDQTAQITINFEGFATPAYSHVNVVMSDGAFKISSVAEIAQ